MKTRIAQFIILALLAPTISTCLAQTTAFTYQGRLSDNGTSANGSYDLEFSIYDANTNGYQSGATLTNLATTVNNGLFTVTLDFGNVFNGSNYWLEIAARTNGGTSFVTLSPRQKITPTPYAITAGNISGAISLGQLPTPILTNGAAGVNISGSFFGNGTGLTNVPGTLNISQINSLATSVTNGQFNIVYIPPNGTNDMSEILNQYLMTPFTKIELASGAVYYCTNLTMTNNVYFDLNYATIIMESGATGYLLDTGIANNSNQTIIHGIFEGQDDSYYELAAKIPLPVNHPEIYPSTLGSSVGPRTGIHLNLGAGGSFSDNLVKGFNGIGVKAFNYYSTGGIINSYFSHNTAIMDFVGFLFNFGFDEPGGCSYLAETAVIDDCGAFYCGIGCMPGAGNDRVQGCTFNNNFIGWSQNAGCNSAHGIISHCTLNHNTYPFYSSTTSGGELIEGCALYDNVYPGVFYNCGGGIVISGCHGEPAFLATNNTQLTFNNNGWNPGVYNVTGVLMAVSNSAIYFNNNQDGVFSDYTSIYGPGMVSNNVVTYAGSSGNGSGLTNLDTYYPSNVWDLAAFTNGMANFSFKTGSSNGVALISLYLSNGVAYIKTLQ